MSNLRGIWHGAVPPFPPTDQHPDARRFGPITLTDGRVVFVDALGPQPSVAEIEAALPPSPQGFGAPSPPPAAARLDAHLQSAIADLSAPAKGNPAMTQQSPASHALTIKEVLEDHAKKLDQVLQTQLALLTSELDGQLGTVVKGTDAVIARVRGHTDDFKAILGQFTNEVG